MLIKEIRPKFFKRLEPFLDFFTCTVPWYLTWFSHSLKDFDKVSRVYDFLICSHPLMIVSLVVAVILESETEFNNTFDINEMIEMTDFIDFSKKIVEYGFKNIEYVL